jgi:hypothetical protein
VTKTRLSGLLAALHTIIQQNLEIARESIHHPGNKGEASERVWIGLLETYLPKRYSVASAHVVDSEGAFSDQIDVVIFDRQYTPFVFDFQGQKFVPAEAVYAVFECKQAVSAQYVRYAQEKVRSVRSLVRTSKPVSWLGKPTIKKPEPIIGGLLTLASDWTPALGEPLLKALREADEMSVLGITCVASEGTVCRVADQFEVKATEKAATAFLFELLAQLQQLGSAPMLDIRAYAKWL